ncbi:thiamine biosynthesis protein ThiH [Candidatus Omnitrophus magneticus]|uniref:Thiamine biosynthesis protein ThiH n=1 Tax=Candidatus Omnitrophus magneticus TaxID=1609969 RepID=A0A0F0CS65_9BACT|nr:thiamine biosynthesis protein ThiH [Candidatus Omnitrophus magneticus]
MKYIDGSRIKDILDKARNIRSERVKDILNKSKELHRLTLEETAVLLSLEGEENERAILSTASFVKNKIYGKRVVLFAPLYISNVCSNYCTYCSFKADNNLFERKKLTQKEIARETNALLKAGHKRILMVAGENGSLDKGNADFYVESIRTIYSERYGENRISRINVNCAPLNEEGFKKLKKEGIGTYQLFQETYHDDTYKEVHPKGPKSDPDVRIEAIDKAFRAGIDDVGIGVLYGLYDYKFETLGLLMHTEHLEKTFGVGPHTISVPRVKPACGAEYTNNVPYKVSDKDFKKLIAIIRLSVPYTGIILSTRETPYLRDSLFDCGVSQISAGSSTSPGGYSGSNEGDKNTQFILNDHRSLDGVVMSLIDGKLIPSFCTACYREGRTGKTFMGFANTGTIKGKCAMNALITLKEYLDDHSSEITRKKGYALIDECKNNLNEDERKRLSKIFQDIDRGKRDEHI